MRIYFKTEELKNFYETSLEAIRGKRHFPREVLKQYKKRIELLIEITKLEELRRYRGLYFEYLKGTRKGQCSLRLNDKYRLIITPMDEKTIQIILINEISKHYE